MIPSVSTSNPHSILPLWSRVPLPPPIPHHAFYSSPPLLALFTLAPTNSTYRIPFPSASPALHLSLNTFCYHLTYLSNSNTAGLCGPLIILPAVSNFTLPRLTTTFSFCLLLKRLHPIFPFYLRQCEDLWILLFPEEWNLSSFLHLCSFPPIRIIDWPTLQCIS